MNWKKYLTPWWVYFATISIVFIWMGDNAIQGKLTQWHGFLIAALGLINVFIAHAWRTFYLHEKEIKESMFNAMMEAQRENERK